MRDTTTQTVLGMFVATFLYCLIVLRAIRRADESAFVPHLSVSFAVLLTVASVGLLIYFIHHLSVSIQANEVVALVGTELIEGMESLFPEKIGRGASEIPTAAPDAAFLETFGREARPIGSAEDGYLQAVDGDALMDLAMREDIVIQLEQRPGHFVVANRPLMLVWPGNRITDELVKRAHSAFSLDNQRSSVQDIEFAVSQLVEIAARALSTGMNDPFTATTCVDHLGAALCRLAQRDMPSPYRHDSRGRLRVITPVFTFPDVTDAAFNQIRQYGRSSAAVTIRLLETIAVVAAFARRPEDRAALLRHAEMIARGAREALPEAEDRRVVEERFQSVHQILGEFPDTNRPGAHPQPARRKTG
jgi:uncharacterized membrane protein